MSRGAFIVLEGLDGAGTTTQCAALADALRARGRAVWITREPSGGPVGTLIRQALTGRLGLPGGRPLGADTLGLLFAADRVDHVEAEIRPMLAQGAVVLSDRYLLSSLAYQGALLGMGWVAELNRRAVRPDLTVFLQVSTASAAARRRHRGGGDELYDDPRVQERTRRQYQAAIRLLRRRGERLAVVDGNRPPAEVTRLALAEIDRVLSPRRSR